MIYLITNKKCLYCEKEIPSFKNSNALYCSIKCRYTFKRHGCTKQKYEENKLYNKTCEFCGESFVVNKMNSGHKNKKFCSKKCCIKLYEINNVESIKEHQARYRKTQKRRDSNNRYAKKNRLKTQAYFVKRYHTNEQFNIAIKFRRRIYMAIRNSYTEKAASTIELLGCDYKTLKKHIEKQFTDNMTWDKMLEGKIHIDHIIPCASFDLTKIEEQRKCFHYTNLQPLWAKENLRKSKKIKW